MALQDRIRQRLATLQLSARQASLRASKNDHFVSDLLSNRARSPTWENLRALAAALETTPEWLSGMENGDDTVPLEGYVVLAGQITPLDTADDLQWVEKPLDADGVIGAAIVRGDGIEPAYHDGDTVYWGEWSPELAAMVGREVVAELADSRLFLRRLLPGSRAGLYTLVGVGGAAMLDQQVIRAARVRWVKRAD